MDSTKSIVDGAYMQKILKRTTFPFDNMEAAMRYHEVHVGRYAVTANALEKLPLRHGMKILEMAASPYGMTAYLCHRFGKSITLATYADPASQRRLNIGVGSEVFELEEYGFNAEQGDWPLRDGSFDLVIACEIVEHLAMDPMALFAGANRVLRPGGHLLISTPNAASLQNFLKLGRLLPAGLAPHFRRPFTMASLYERHNREYSPFTIGEMLTAAGFEVALMETDSSYPLDNLNFPQEVIERILECISIPELRRDTITVAGRKVGAVRDRFPTSHDLYLAEDN